jgi:hypothetical protein
MSSSLPPYASLSDYLRRAGRIAFAVGLACLVASGALFAMGDALAFFRWPFGGMFLILGVTITATSLTRLWRGIDGGTQRALKPYGDPREVLAQLDSEWKDAATIQSWKNDAFGPWLVLTRNWLIKLHVGTLEVMKLREIQRMESKTLSDHQGNEFHAIIVGDSSCREMIAPWSRDGRDEIVNVICQTLGRTNTSFQV